MGLQEETKKCLVYISIVKHYFPSAFFLRIQKCVMQLPVNYQLKHAIYIIYV